MSEEERRVAEEVLLAEMFFLNNWGWFEGRIWFEEWN